MKLSRLLEYLYIKKNLRETINISLQIKNAECIRIYMLPPKSQWNRTVPYILIINGVKMLPIGVSWAVMFQCLIKRIHEFGKLKIDKDNYEIIIEEAVLDTKIIYPAMHVQEIRKEMNQFLNVLTKQDKMVPFNAFHPICSDKEYAASFQKSGNTIWQYPDPVIAAKESVQLEKINGMLKGRSV